MHGTSNWAVVSLAVLENPFETNHCDANLGSTKLDNTVKVSLVQYSPKLGIGTGRGASIPNRRVKSRSFSSESDTLAALEAAN